MMLLHIPQPVVQQHRIDDGRRPGEPTVDGPAVGNGDRHVGGFDDLAALEFAGELDPLLAPG